MESKKQNNRISIELTKEEYLVFFDWLVRFNESVSQSNFVDSSEQIILWEIEALLEKVIDETFESNYKDILINARRIIKEKN